MNLLRNVDKKEFASPNVLPTTHLTVSNHWKQVQNHGKKIKTKDIGRQVTSAFSNVSSRTSGTHLSLAHCNSTLWSDTTPWYTSSLICSCHTHQWFQSINTHEGRPKSFRPTPLFMHTGLNGCYVWLLSYLSVYQKRLCYNNVTAFTINAAAVNAL